MLPLMITAIEDENDREFMERLYLQYHRLIYSEVRKLVQNEDEAEDLMQTVVEKLIHKVDLLRDLERRRLAEFPPGQSSGGQSVGGAGTACRSRTYAGGEDPLP